MVADAVTLIYFSISLIVLIGLCILCMTSKRKITADDFFTIVSFCVLWPFLILIVIFGVVDYTHRCIRLKKDNKNNG